MYVWGLNRSRECLRAHRTAAVRAENDKHSSDSSQMQKTLRNWNFCIHVLHLLGMSKMTFSKICLPYRIRLQTEHLLILHWNLGNDKGKCDIIILFLNSFADYEGKFRCLEQQTTRFMKKEGLERKKLTSLSGLHYDLYCKDPNRVL